MNENSLSDGKTKLENLISLSEAFTKNLPKVDFQANPAFFQQRE